MGWSQTDELNLLSKYCKEELPTWAEIYHDFYKEILLAGERAYYDPNFPDDDKDAYWLMSRRKYILAVVCNQLNKMIFEDGKKDPLLEFLASKDERLKGIHDVRFVLADIPFDSSSYAVRAMGDVGGPPKIYNFRLASNGKYSIFTTDYPRIDISQISGPIELVMSTSSEKCISRSDSDGPGIYFDAISLILKEILDYFGGGKVGWKDENGDVIPTEPMSHGCQGVGVDAAL